jgi:hypothetical protein
MAPEQGMNGRPGARLFCDLAERERDATEE